MIFYHGTKEKKWRLIKSAGILWGYRIHNGKKTLLYRYTYLTPELCIAEKYGNIILQVEYVPTGIWGIDNYGFHPPPDMTCWQFSVFVPISLSNVKVMD